MPNKLDWELTCRKRGYLRAGFTKAHKAFVEYLGSATESLQEEVIARFAIVESKHLDIVELDRIILEHLYELDPDDKIETQIATELEAIDQYTLKYHSAKARFDAFFQTKAEDSVSNQSNPTVQFNNVGSHNFRLPKLELAKYSGDVAGWIQFWALFSCIDEDTSLSKEEKFQYLIQSTTPKSRARSLVESFPPSGENYSKAVQALKERFGRQDLLVEFYIRELLGLVNNHELKLAALYDKLEAQLRALETLKVVSDDYAAILFPLIESCVPAETLKIWQRSNVNHGTTGLKAQMDSLMLFLKSEVEAEERVSMACAKQTHCSSRLSKRVSPGSTSDRCSTASDLANLSLTDVCVFCNGRHDSVECRKALNMSLEEKKNMLSTASRCFACTKRGHPARRCRAKCSQCQGRHVSVMCSKASVSSSESKICLSTSQKGPPARESDLLAINHSLSVGTSPDVFLQTFSAVLYNGDLERLVRILVDSGSQRSYIRSSVAKEMGYKPYAEESLIHSLFGGGSIGLVKHSRYKVHLRSLDDKFACNFSVLNQENIASFIPMVEPSQSVLKELTDHNIRLIKDMSGPVDVLIGADVAGKVWNGHLRVLSSGFVTVGTSFGWTLIGSDKRVREPTVVCSSNLATTYTMTTMTTGDVSDLWRLEVIGISDPGSKREQEERKQAALEHFKKTVDFVDGKYQVHLPWRDIASELPPNRELAEGRLIRTSKKLKGTGSLFQEYDAVFREWLRMNIIEEASDGLKGHFLPHRPIVKESSTTTKVRPVFDASAKLTGYPSLNDCLEEGPNMIELLPDILLRFREKAIGVSADIEKAFLMISIHPDDRAFLKFLWWSSEEDRMVVFQHARVVFGLTCSPFLLAAVLDYHINKCLENSLDEAAWLKVLQQSFYVDNLATSVESIAEAEQLQRTGSAAMAAGGFNLRGWEFTQDNGAVPVTSMLGLKWNRHQDTLSLNLDWWEKWTQTDILTKRTVLSMTQRIFDPIGFSIPVTLHLKLMIQTLWDKKVDWDEPLDEENRKQFESWLQSVHLLKHISIDRKLIGTCNLSLHLFSDASSKAYAACIFVRSETEDGEVIVSLLQAKSRVAPLKGLTIPRLELMGITIGVRLLKSVEEALGWTEVPAYAWSDSSTALTWIQRQEEWSVFVRNRVKEVRELTPHVIWRHIPGSLNPADLPSRGCSINQFLKLEWWKGPDWLKESASEWPQSQCSYVEEEVCAEKVKRASTLISVSVDHSWLYRYFSKFEKIVRMVGWVYRVRYNCCQRNKSLKKEGELTIDELTKAENTVCRLIQEETFESLSDKRISELRPFKDDEGVIRVKTKITERDDSDSFTNPIVLPHDHPVMERMVFDYHCKHHHVGAQTLWSSLREKFWILKGRQLTRNVVQKCVVCRRFSSKCFNIEPPPLPQARVSDASVFEVCGVDYAGPLTLRDGQKVWIALFTCGVYRAIHMELVSSLSTEAFLLALRRFIARRGRPRILYSDNGTCFQGANNDFGTLDWKKISSYSSVERIEWRFNPPTASWWGGFFERMIQTVKRLLRRTLGRAALVLDELYTILCECESLVNSRPITPPSETNVDPVALTPSFFLQDMGNNENPDCDVVDSSSLDRRRRYRQKLLEQLRARFRSEYLGTLKWTRQNGKTREPLLGEVVLIGADDTKRMDWSLGKIEEMIRGRDGNIRVLKLKTAKGVLMRPLQRVFPLEVGVTDSTILKDADEDSLPFKPSEEHVLEDSSATMSQSQSLEGPEAAGQSSGPCLTKHGRKVKIPRRLDL